jgi:hypothetical protein
MKIGIYEVSIICIAIMLANLSAYVKFIQKEANLCGHYIIIYAESGGKKTEKSFPFVVSLCSL